MNMAKIRKICAKLWPASILLIGLVLFQQAKQMLILFYLSRPIGMFWSARYIDPCGNGSDFGRRVLRSLIFFDEPLLAMGLLEAASKAKFSQCQWESVTGLYSYIGSIDKNGRIGSVKWRNLCNLLDNRLEYLFLLQARENSGCKASCISIDCDSGGLVEGYEHHNLMDEAEKWLVRSENQQLKIKGIDSFRFAKARLDHANFCYRHGRVTDANDIAKSVAQHYRDQIVTFEKQGTGGYFYLRRKDGNNFVKFTD